MPDYEKLYAALFNAFTAAVEQMESRNYGLAEATLKQAQQKTEEMYIESE